MTNLWHDIDRKTKEEFNVIVECPKGSRVKYEVDKETGLIMFDRVLYTPMHYNNNYGFVPQTLWEDGDPLDVLVLNEEPLVPGALVKCRAVAVLDMVDGGEGDAKILAVPVKDPRFEHVKDLGDVSPHFLEEVREFFRVYKNLQKKEVEVGEWKSRDEALKDIETSFKAYDDKYKK